MARQIATTPTLYGNDAKRFVQKMSEAKAKKVSKEKVEQMKKAYESVIANSK